MHSRAEARTHRQALGSNDSPDLATSLALHFPASCLYVRWEAPTPPPDAVPRRSTGTTGLFLRDSHPQLPEKYRRKLKRGDSLNKVWFFLIQHAVSAGDPLYNTRHQSPDPACSRVTRFRRSGSNQHPLTLSLRRQRINQQRNNLFSLG